jgi:hypothetical protein
MDEFMELMGQVNQLAITLKAKFAKENERGVANDAKSEELSKRETAVSEKESDLNQREAKVQGIESVVQLKQDAIELKKQANKAMADAVEQKEINALENKNAKDALAVERKRLADADVKLLDGIESLRIGWDQLRKKEKTYKEEINAKITGLKV